LVDGGHGLAGEFAGVVEGEFELDGGESAKATLSASPVVGPFDPDHDLDAEVLAVVQGWRSRTFFWRSEKNDSMAALSPAEATRPIDPASPAPVRTRRNALDRN
jgi:hypothetical protein